MSSLVREIAVPLFITIPPFPPVVPETKIELPLQSGTFTAPMKGWNTVRFPTAFVERPRVIALMEYRKGWFKPKKYVAPRVEIPKVPKVVAPTISVPTIKIAEAPTISVPKITLPTAPTIKIPEIAIPPVIEIERVQRVDFRYRVASWCREEGKRRLGDWGWLNWARDRLLLFAYWLGYAIGYFLNWFWDRFIQPQIDKVRDSIHSSTRKLRDDTQKALNSYRYYIQTSVNEGLKKSRDYAQRALNEYRGYIQRSVNTGLRGLRDYAQEALNAYRGSIQRSINEGLAAMTAGVNTSLTDFRGRLQGTIDRVTKFAEDAINTAIPMLWEMEGLETGMLMSTVQIRNVTPQSFDVWSPAIGAVFHWVAIGRR